MVTVFQLLEEDFEIKSSKETGLDETKRTPGISTNSDSTECAIQLNKFVLTFLVLRFKKVNTPFAVHFQKIY